MCKVQPTTPNNRLGHVAYSCSPIVCPLIQCLYTYHMQLPFHTINFFKIIYFLLVWVSIPGVSQYHGSKKSHKNIYHTIISIIQNLWISVFDAHQCIIYHQTYFTFLSSLISPLSKYIASSISLILLCSLRLWTVCWISMIFVRWMLLLPWWLHCVVVNSGK